MIDASEYGGLKIDKEVELCSFNETVKQRGWRPTKRNGSFSSTRKLRPEVIFRCILNISNFKEGIHSDGSLLKEILGSELKQTDRLERVKQALKFFFFSRPPGIMAQLQGQIMSQFFKDWFEKGVSKVRRLQTIINRVGL